MKRRGTVTESWSEEQHCKLNKSIFNLWIGLPVYHLPEGGDFFAGVRGISEVVLGRLRAGLHESRETYWEERRGGGQGGESGGGLGRNGGERGGGLGREEV